MAQPARTPRRPELALLAGVLVALLGATLTALERTGHPLPGLEAIERRLLDLRFQLRGPRPPGPEAVVVTFDDRTLAEDPSLFEKRDGMARVLTALHSAGAKVVGVDALLTDPEQVLPLPLVKDVDAYLEGHRPEDDAAPDALLRRVQHETRGDLRLTEALRGAGNVVLGFHLGKTGGGGRTVAASTLTRGRYGQSVRGPWEPEEASDAACSLPAFNQAAKALGILTITEDEGHTVRELPMVRRYQGGEYAPLAVELVAAFRGLSRGQLAYVGTDHSVRVGEQEIPLNGSDAILLNYRGPSGTFPGYSAIDVARGTVPPGALAGKIVVLGFSVLGSDFTRNAFGGGFRGPEMHATAVDNLLRGDWLTRASWRTDTWICLVLGLLVVVAFWHRLALPLPAQVGVLFALLAGYLAVSFALFSRQGLWLSWVGPTLSWTLVFATLLIASYAREGLERRRLRHAFGRYLADDVIRELLANPSALTLGGSRRHLTVLFSDVRNFTTISEKVPPEKLALVLNRYLTPMTRAVLANGGFLDKFIGDAVMAVFGAPLPNPGHPAQACACALRMHEELRALQPGFAELGVTIEIGVGLNSGEMVVGNMGSEEHFNYTVLGDAVNLASRLESLTKTYGVFCLVGQDTRQRAGDAFRFRELDLVQVKGKDEPVAISELLSGPGVELSRPQGLELWDAAVRDYRAGALGAARGGFQEYLARNPGDRAAQLFLERIEELGDTPPPEWKGVWVFKTK